LTLNGAGITDPQGLAMAGNQVLLFHALTGDANGDRVTNDSDLYRVWQNLLRPEGARDLNDDLNGDGVVDNADVAVVTGNYLALLPEPAPLIITTPILADENSPAASNPVEAAPSTVEADRIESTNVATAAPGGVAGRDVGYAGWILNRWSQRTMIPLSPDIAGEGRSEGVPSKFHGRYSAFQTYDVSRPLDGRETSGLLEAEEKKPGTESWHPGPISLDPFTTEDANGSTTS
jgi:hypothetical protein